MDSIVRVADCSHAALAAIIATLEGLWRNWLTAKLVAQVEVVQDQLCFLFKAYE